MRIFTFLLIFVGVFTTYLGWGQTTIAQQGFEVSGETWSIITGGGNISSATGSGDTPASQRIRTNSRSWQVINSSSGTTLELGSVNVSSYTSIKVTMRLSSTSVTSGNGSDGADNVKIFANLNGSGFPGTPDITLAGNSNARWGYNATLTASTTAGTPISLAAPQGGTNTNNYSTLEITIPNGTTTVALRAIALNNDANEVWNIDDIELIGTAATGTTTITAGAGAEPATISSLTNTQGASALNFDIDVNDVGGDSKDTKITQMVFAQGTGNDVGTWTNVIAGAELTDGTNTMTGTINATNITFSSINTANLGLVSDNTTKNYILKVWLKTDFGSEKLTADGKNLVFRIQNSNISVDPSGSAFATAQDQNSGSANNEITVVATALAYVQNATTTQNNAIMTPAVTLSANDANGNRDLGWVTPVQVSSTGTLTGDPVTGSLSSGLATFDMLTHTVPQTARQLTASSTGLTSATSSMFDVTAVLTNTITAGAGAEPASISALINAQGDAVLNFDINITDDGATPGNDNLDTKITLMVFQKGASGNTVADWSTVLAGAELSDGTNSMTGTIGASTITFSAIDVANLGLIADNASKTYTLKVWLKSDLGGLKLSIDGQRFVFRIQNTDISVDNTGSGFATGQDVNSGTSNNTVAVVATVLAFVQNASNVNKGASMSPTVTVSANDANGNRDLGWATPITMTSTGTLTGSPVTGSLSSGVASFSTLTHTVAETARELTAASVGTSSVTSSLFNVNDVSLTTDHFRTKASGNWGSTATWESSSDEITWINATLTPSSSAKTINIKSPNVIDITISVTVDQVTIENGATLDVQGGTLTVADGTDSDIFVQGIIKNSTNSAFTINSGATIVVASGGKYQHNPSTAGSITVMTWNTGSTCEILRANATPGGTINQSYHHFIWNSQNQGATTINLSSGLKTINGDFTVQNTGTGKLRIASSTNVLDIAGNMTMEDGTYVDLGNASGNSTININGNLTMNGSCTLDLMGANASNINGFINLKGNLNASNNSVITESTSQTGCLFAFNGSSQQTASFGSLPQRVNFEINASPGVSLGTSMTLSSSADLKLTSGYLILNNFDLNMGSSGTTITGGSNSSYVQTNGTGTLKRTVAATSINFPIGNATYNPLVLSNSGTSDIYSARVSDAVLAQGDSGAPYTEKVVNRTWLIDETVVGGSNVSATFQWSSGDELSNFNRALCYTGHFTSGAWSVGATGAASGSNPYTRQRTNITTFSPFAVASSGALPVVLSKFTATKRKNSVDLQWQTLSETNCDYFGIERSNNGNDYNELSQIRGAGTTISTNDYQYTDHAPAQGDNYYRLRQVDFDGSFSYSPIRVISMDKGKDINVIPTVAYADIRLDFSESLEADAQIDIIEVSTGRIVQTINLSAETSSQTISVADFAAGMYFVKMVNGSEVITKRFVVIK